MSHPAEVIFPGAVYDSSPAASMGCSARIALSLFCSTQQHVNKLLIHQSAERGGSGWQTLRGSASLHNLREHYKKTSNFDGTQETQADNRSLCSRQLSMQTGGIHNLPCSFIDIVWLSGNQCRILALPWISARIYTPALLSSFHLTPCRLDVWCVLKASGHFLACVTAEHNQQYNFWPQHTSSLPNKVFPFLQDHWAVWAKQENVWPAPCSQNYMQDQETLNPVGNTLVVSKLNSLP